MAISFSAPTIYKAASAQLTHTIPLPTALDGDMLVIAVQADSGDLTGTAPTGFTFITGLNSNNGRDFAVFAKVAGASEPTTVDYNDGFVNLINAHSYLVTGATTSIAEVYGGQASGNGFQSPNMNPPSLLAGGGVQEYGWLAGAFIQANEGFSGGPANYTSTESLNTAPTTALAIATAYRVLEAETEDPGAFTSTAANPNWAAFTVAITPSAGGPAIANIDTDNAVNQYQQAIVNVSGFTETITSVTLGGIACTVPENDPTDDQITVGVPGSLTTGTYDLVISGATETDTLTGVSYTQTHARPAFDGLVDSNSILSGQSYTADTYFRFVTSFSNGTLDTAAGDAAEWQDDIADYYTPDAGFTGDDTASIEFLYADGTTSATVGVTISVVDGAVDTWPFGKGINPAATKNWEWGKRHPKTNMRVRIYK